MFDFSLKILQELVFVRIWCTLLGSLWVRTFMDMCSICTGGMFWSSYRPTKITWFSRLVGCRFCLSIFHVLRRDAKVYQAGGRTWLQLRIRSCLQKGCDGTWIILGRFRPQHQRRGTRLLTGRSEWHLRFACENFAQKFGVTVAEGCNCSFGRIHAIRSLCWYDVRFSRKNRCKHFGTISLNNGEITLLKLFHSRQLVSQLVTWFDTRTGGCRKQFGVEMSGSLARARIWPFATWHQSGRMQSKLLFPWCLVPVCSFVYPGNHCFPLWMFRHYQPNVRTAA